MACGFVLLDKPQGLSSQQAIYSLRKKLALPKSIKIGHGGTLDPLATGMLVMALGSATKFLGYLLNANKTYAVTAKLGQVTTTLDAEGEILSDSPVPELDKTKIANLFNQFTGTLEQIPPMYSALKFQGRPLYHYARKGQEIIRPPRSVHIFELILQDLEKDNFSFISRVSKGTYIRSLVHDMGQSLGCGAHVQVLHRAQVDPFLANQMAKVEQISLSSLLSIDSIFTHLPALIFNDDEIKKLKSGQKLNTSEHQDLTSLKYSKINCLYRAYDAQDKQFVALVKMEEEGRIKGEKWV